MAQAKPACFLDQTKQDTYLQVFNFWSPKQATLKRLIRISSPGCGSTGTHPNLSKPAGSQWEACPSEGPAGRKAPKRSFPSRTGGRLFSLDPPQQKKRKSPGGISRGGPFDPSLSIPKTWDPPVGSPTWPPPNLRRTAQRKRSPQISFRGAEDLLRLLPSTGAQRSVEADHVRAEELFSRRLATPAPRSYRSSGRTKTLDRPRVSSLVSLEAGGFRLTKPLAAEA